MLAPVYRRPGLEFEFNYEHSNPDDSQETYQVWFCREGWWMLIADMDGESVEKGDVGRSEWDWVYEQVMIREDEHTKEVSNFFKYLF